MNYLNIDTCSFETHYFKSLSWLSFCKCTVVDTMFYEAISGLDVIIAASLPYLIDTEIESVAGADYCNGDL